MENIKGPLLKKFQAVAAFITIFRDFTFMCFGGSKKFQNAGGWVQ